MKINKTSRRVGFHKMPISGATKKVGGTLIGGQIKPTGPIKRPKLPKHGGFPKGHVY